MTLPSPNLPTQPEDDHHKDDARHEIADVIRALNHVHPIMAWGILLGSGELLVQCGCDKEYRVASSSHYRDALWKVRKLDQLPKPKR